MNTALQRSLRALLLGVLITLLTLLSFRGMVGEVAAQEPLPTADSTTLDQVLTTGATLVPAASATATKAGEPSATATATATASATAEPSCDLDAYEPDDSLPQAHRLVTDEVQQRTFCSTGDDQDYVVVLLKRGQWRLAARTSTGAYDPRLTIGEWVADDTATSKDAVLDITVEADTEYLMLVENMGVDSPGLYTLSLEKVGDYPEATPTPTVPAPTVGPGAEDPYENDTPPHQPGYSGPQLRTFNPNGDVDFVRYRLKAGLPTWFQTSDLTGGADTVIHVLRDDDGAINEGDVWLGSDDDSGEGLRSNLLLEVEADMWVRVMIENKGSGWGPATGYSFRILTAEQATPTPTSTPRPTEMVPPPAPPLPTVRPTYTAYPTYTPFPSPTATVMATYTPYPTYTPAPRVQETGSQPNTAPVTGGANRATDSQPAPAPAAPPVAPILPTPVTPSTLRLEVFLDSNQNGLMDWGEEINDVLVYVTTRQRTWESEAYTQQGEALIPLSGLPTAQEVLVLVPYLHRSGVVSVEGTLITSSIDLTLPVYPAYLP